MFSGFHFINEQNNNYQQCTSVCVCVCNYRTWTSMDMTDMKAINENDNHVSVQFSEMRVLNFTHR